MRKHKVVTAALALALALCAVVVMTASAAAPAAGKPTKMKPFTLKANGTTTFAAAAAATTAKPVTKDSKRADLGKLVNRAIPGKQAKTRSPNDPYDWPVVNPTNIFGPKGAPAAKGLNALDSAQVNGFDLEPPDQAMCVGNGYVLEGVNLVWAVYNSSTFAKLTSDASLNAFFNLDPEVFTSDPKCYYDPATGHWFATALAIFGAGDSPTGHVPVSPTSAVLLAVSQTGDPRLGWYQYQIDTTDDGNPNTVFNDPHCPCFGDQPLLGANQDAIIITTNEFPIEGPGFNGAVGYALEKSALVAGALPNQINADAETIGLDIPTPDGACDPNEPVTCWYSVQPSTSPATDWDTHQGGTAWGLSALEFYGDADSRIALWALTNTSSLNGAPGSANLFANYLIVNSETYHFPEYDAVQMDDHTLPFGTWWDGEGTPPAGPITANDDRMNATVYSDHIVWGGVNTALYQQFKAKCRKEDPIAPDKSCYVNEPHDGIAYFGVSAGWDKQGNMMGTMKVQGYVAPAHEDAVFPSIGMNNGRPNKNGAMAFTLTGRDYYPSSAYVLLAAATGNSRVYISALGRGSEDGFVWYVYGYNRWGDYSAAASYNGKIYISSEYIQYPNCSYSAWLGDPTCGNTRSFQANWGTSIGAITP